MATEKQENQFSSDSESFLDTNNWVDGEDWEQVRPTESVAKMKNSKITTKTVVTVETAFLASAASLIWLINYYFPLGPFLRIFFPIPIALVYIRRGNRASWMTALVAGLLLSVLMGPTRSIIFLIPYGVMGILLGACWDKKTSWSWSIPLGALIGSVGLLFRLWLFSILLGEDLWVYLITQITEIADWIFLKLGILAEPSFFLIQILTIMIIFFNNLIYLLAVHLIALMLLDRLGNPISRPPKWIQILLDY